MTASRLRSLDGLRGLAAVVVVIHHSLLTFPLLADAYYGMSGRGGKDAWWVLSYTPMHTFWGGAEAVYLFFVLSGVVLVLPVLKAPRAFSWLAYYPRRLTRLYLPLIAAVLFGAALVILVPRTRDPALGAWMDARKSGYSLSKLFEDVTLLFGPSGVISPLWSLKWEVAFSLLLPLFILFVVVGARLWWAKLAAVFAMLAVGSVTQSTFLFFLPMFAVGALLIAEWEYITVLARSLDGRRWAWPVVIVIATLLTSITWTLLGMGVPRSALKYVDWVPVAGVALFVIVGASYSPARRLLESRLFAWLGTISFSLYLLHEPLIISARLLTPQLPPWVGLLISLPMAFVLAALFTRFVEQPAHRLAKWLGTTTRDTLTRNRGIDHLRQPAPTVPVEGSVTSSAGTTSARG